MIKDILITRNSVEKLIHSAYTADQEMRLSGSWNDQVDINNTALLSQLFVKLGPLNYKIASKETVMKSLMIVLHADLNSTFQSMYVESTSMNASLYPLDKLAYLVDRVKVNFGEKQIYGTQLILNNGKYVPLPIRDIKKINQIRKSVNLSTLKVYIKNANKYLTFL